MPEFKPWWFEFDGSSVKTFIIKEKKMNEKQGNKLLGVLVEHQKEFSGLTTEEAQWVIMEPKAAIDLFVAAIKNRNSKDFKIWKTIHLGIGLKTADEFRGALKGGEFRISDWANDIMGKPGFTVSSEKAELDLVIVTAAELGFPKGATRKEIYERAQSLSLELCPPEAGPQLRLQYRDQPNGEWLLIAMEPIKDSDGDPFVFGVERCDVDLWLYAGYVYPGGVWNPDYRWVFALRK